MEKLKDIIHDYADILMSILVVVIIVFIIGTNFTFFDQNLAGFIGSSDNESPSNQSPVVSDDSHNEGDEPSQEEPTENEATEEEPESEEVAETITVEIPQGATAAQIGDILHSHDLVSNSSEFVQESENNNVSHRLRPGTFEIPSNANLREIIQILIQRSL